MAELESSAAQKRQAWATRSGTETYVQEMGRYALRRDERIVRDMLGRGPGRLLDLPCGTGRFLDLEKDLCFQVTAADYSPTMLEVAKRHSDVEFMRVDAFNPPFAPQTFDVIMILRLLFHYARPEAIIGSLLPSLKNGGRMIFDTLNRFSTRWTLSQILRPFRPPAGQLYFESIGSMQRKLSAMGLKVMRRQSCYLLPTRSYRFLPRPCWTLSDAVEKITPPSLRVLTYWEVCRADTEKPA